MRHLKVLGAFTFLAFGAAAVWASVTFTPPDTKEVRLGTVVLTAEKAAGKASGTATLVCTADLGKGTLTIIASGLDPKKVYTVWLVKMAKPKAKPAKMEGKMKMEGMAGMEMMGVGKAPYRLPVSDKGYANLAAPVKNCREVVMQRLEIVEHPTKKATDMKNMVPVFTADLMKMMQGQKMPGMKM